MESNAKTQSGTQIIISGIDAGELKWWILFAYGFYGNQLIADKAKYGRNRKTQFSFRAFPSRSLASIPLMRYQTEHIELI